MWRRFIIRRRNDVQFGDSVLVIGIGPVGLMSVAGASLRGASRIICVGTRPNCVAGDETSAKIPLK